MSRVDIWLDIENAQVWQFGIEFPRCIERDDIGNLPALPYFHFAIGQWKDIEGRSVAQDERNIHIVIGKIGKALMDFFEQFVKGYRIVNPDFQHILFA